MLPELADLLIDLAEHHRAAGDLGEAEKLCKEAVTIAASRTLLTTHANALATRARVRADRFVSEATPQDRDRAEDDIEQALRLATRFHRLPWCELRALEAQAYFRSRTSDGQEYASDAVKILRDRLIPPMPA